MKKPVKIIVCAASVVALSFSLIIPSYAADGSLRPSDTYVKYEVDANPDMYDDIVITATQYLDTSDEDVELDDMLKIQKTFRIDDCNVFEDGLGNYVLQLLPYSTRWFYESGVGNYNTAGRFEFEVTIPFTNSLGESFEEAKLNEFNILKYIEMAFNMYMVNDQAAVLKRGICFYVNTVDGGYIPIRESTFDDKFSGINDFQISKALNLSCQTVKNLVFRFSFSGLPRPETVFTFTMDHRSYLQVFDEYSFYADSADDLLEQSKDYLDDMKNNGVEFEFPDLSSLDSFWSEIRYYFEGFNLFPYINFNINTLNVGDYGWIHHISLLSTMSLVIALVSFILFGRK